MSPTQGLVMNDETSAGYPLVLHSGADSSKLGGVAICGFSTVGSVGVICCFNILLDL